MRIRLRQWLTAVNLSVFFYNNSAWTKKNTDKGFDVAQESFYGADICELFGNLLDSALNRDRKHLWAERAWPLSLWWCRHCKNQVRYLHKTYLKKILKKVFSKLDLKITIESNLVNAKFLDVELDLTLKLRSKLRTST